MRLEDCAAEIRPRRPWEAVDLGCALVRKWSGTLAKSWLMTVLPVCLLIWAVCWNHPFLGFFVIWWFRPVFERVPLHIMSRSLFGEVPRSRSVLRRWPKLFFNKALTYWFGIRFQSVFSRSLHMPIRELEGLDGAQYRHRSRIIERHAGHTASFVTFTCLIIEAALCLGLVALVLFLIPEMYLPNIMIVVELVFQSGPASVPIAVWRAVLLLSIFSMGIMQTIYVGAGFGLYTNSRSHVEGWDIELTFRRIANRLAPPTGQAAALLIGLFILGLLGAPTLHAQDDDLWSDPDGKPEAAMKEIMEHPDFEVHSKTVVDRQMRNSGLNIPGLGMLGYVLFWIFVAVIIGGIIYAIIKYGRNLVPSKLGDKPSRERAPTSVMGMSIAPESLPDDILTAARKLWDDGKAQEAVSLLYRGAISHLVNREALPIRESDTENDCLRRSRELEDTSLVDYFAKLTRAWITTAYARRLPSDEAMSGLLQHWPFAKGQIS